MSVLHPFVLIDDSRKVSMTSIGVNEKRRQKRFVVNVKVFNMDSGDLLGYSANMHTRGMMISSTEKIPLLLEFNVKVEHIRIADDELFQLPLRIRSLWNGPSKNPDFYNTGFLILDPTPETDHAIMQLVDELAVKK